MILVPSGDIIYDSGNIGYKPAAEHHLLGEGGGAFKGVSDLKLINGTDNNFYATVQIQNTTDSTTLSQGTAAKAALVKIKNKIRAVGNVSEVDILKSYPVNDNNNEHGIIDSARSITEFDNEIYFFEGSHPEPGIGTLNSVAKDSTTITPRGIAWRSRLFNPNASEREDNITYSRHIRMSSPMATIRNDLYLHSGYGVPKAIKDTNWESSELLEGSDQPETRIDNWTLLRYGDGINFRSPVIQTNNRIGYDIIQDLAELCFCYIGFDGDTFLMKPRYEPRAALVNDLDDITVMNEGTPGTIEYENETLRFPSSGILRISGRNGTELFQYSGTEFNSITNNNQFTGVKRTQFSTTAKGFCEQSIIQYIDHIIDMENASYFEGPINLLTSRQDLQQLYNIIKISYGEEFLEQEVIARDNTSIAENKPRELELELDLTHHESEWANWLAEQYKNFYSKTRYLLDLQLKPSFYIKTGDFILLREKQRSLIDDQIFQVISVNHRIKPYITELQLRTVSDPS